jgi:hypothetical protein
VSPKATKPLTVLQDNGGKEVLLEKHADVLIADRLLNRHAPKESVSWEYIVRSVDQGALVNIEEYRIHPAAATATAPRPVASTRQTRVPFSHLDKQILLTWVRRASKDTKGNEIYKLLEERVRPRQDRCQPTLLTDLLTPHSIRTTAGSHGETNRSRICLYFLRTSCRTFYRNSPPLEQSRQVVPSPRLPRLPPHQRNPNHRLSHGRQRHQHRQRRQRV